MDLQQPLLPFPSPRSGRHIKTTGLAVAAEKATHIDYSSLRNRQFLLSMKVKKNNIIFEFALQRRILMQLVFRQIPYPYCTAQSGLSPSPSCFSTHELFLLLALSSSFPRREKGEGKGKGRAILGGFSRNIYQPTPFHSSLLPSFPFPPPLRFARKREGKSR